MEGTPQSQRLLQFRAIAHSVLCRRSAKVLRGRLEVRSGGCLETWPDIGAQGSRTGVPRAGFGGEADSRGLEPELGQTGSTP